MGLISARARAVPTRPVPAVKRSKQTGAEDAPVSVPVENSVEKSEASRA
jgi:hypothetical protein